MSILDRDVELLELVRGVSLNDLNGLGGVVVSCSVSLLELDRDSEVVTTSVLHGKTLNLVELSGLESDPLSDERVALI